MAKYFKIDKSRGRDTDVMLIYLKNEEEGKYVSKTYKTVLADNYQSFVMLNGQMHNFLEVINKNRVKAVEISPEEFNETSDRLRDLLC